jgi:hypothetical protein
MYVACVAAWTWVTNGCYKLRCRARVTVSAAPKRDKAEKPGRNHLSTTGQARARAPRFTHSTYLLSRIAISNPYIHVHIPMRWINFETRLQMGDENEGIYSATAIELAL